MSTTNLSAYNKDRVPNAKDMKFTLIVSEWNNEVTFGMRDGAIDTLLKNGAQEENIKIEYVPGSFELVYASKLIQNGIKRPDAILAFGSVVRGGTPHFDYVCQGTTNGLSNLNADPCNNIPVIFGLLTTDNMEQATDRSGGKLGNKGVECAVTAIKMVDFRNRNCK